MQFFTQKKASVYHYKDAFPIQNHYEKIKLYQNSLQKSFTPNFHRLLAKALPGNAMVNCERFELP